jgi:uncharacterized protein (TIGR02145 family)
MDIAGTKMKSTSGWWDNRNGTNSSGFSGLPGGLRGSFGTFDFIGKLGYWWSSAEGTTNIAWYRNLFYDFGDVGSYSSFNGEGLSVRCLRD